MISQHVKSLVLALPTPGAPVVRVSADEDPDLFKASLCGLGATGLLLEVEIEVEAAFRLRETKEAKTLDYVSEHLDKIKASAEHVRLWWYPDGKGIVVGRANRTYEVSCCFSLILSDRAIARPGGNTGADIQPAQPASSLMAHILGFHITQFFLFVARLIPSLTPAVGRWAWWLSKEDSEVVDDGYKVLNFDCLVRHLPPLFIHRLISVPAVRARMGHPG